MPTEHVHADTVTALTIIMVYILFKVFLAVARARIDDENPFIQAINAIQL